MTLLPFPTPFFVDPETGQMGVAETALTPRLASWFAAAPPVQHGSIHTVAAKLSRIGQHAPVPRLHRVEEISGDADFLQKLFSLCALERFISVCM